MSTTQNFVPIKDIKDGIMYMDDGRIKAVLSISSLNLSLKSDDEQSAIIGQFQGFLNTLDFPIQIQVESRRVNIQPYLDMLETKQEDMQDGLLKNQMREYRRFIKSFAEKTNIMNKRFFVVVDFERGQNTNPKSKNPLNNLFGKKEEPGEEIVDDSWRSQLEQRLSIVANGLSGIGLQVEMLGTEELIELFYKIYNPGIEGQSVKEEKD